MRVRTQHLGVRLVGIGALLGAIAVSARPAAAQRTVIQADGAVNVGYTQTTRGTFQADPNAQPADIHDGTLGGFFTEVRPDIAIQTGTQRLTWRAGYQFSGNLSLTGEQLGNYSNSGNLSLAAELTKFTTLTLSAAGSQGGTSFLLAQRPADAGRHLAIQQNLIASTSAPQDHLAQRNSAVSATLSLDRVYARDSYGLEARAGISWLRPLRADLEPYQTMTSALVARYNRDFTENWNGLLTAGIEQVYTDTGSQPLAFLPAASASVRYALYNAVAALDFTHGTATNLQVGAVSLTDKITARGIITLDPREVRALSFSAGVLHNEPLGEVDSVVAAGTGNAFQGDAGFTTAISQNILFSARYSVAYQFDQGANLAPTLVHIALVGVTATYKNTERTTRPVPKRGRRVDGTDAEGFPVIDEPPTP